MFGAFYPVEMGGERDQAIGKDHSIISDLLYSPLYSALGMVALQNECCKHIIFFSFFSEAFTTCSCSRIPQDDI